jgi:hypothetical protein
MTPGAGGHKAGLRRQRKKYDVRPTPEVQGAVGFKVDSGRRRAGSGETKARLRKAQGVGGFKADCGRRME